MPLVLSIPNVDPFWVAPRHSLAFPAVVQNRTVRFLVPGEVLRNRLGAASMEPNDLRKAFDTHREEIYSAAHKTIRDKQDDTLTEIVLGLEYFPQSTTTTALPYTNSELQVAYSPAIEQSPELRQAALAATELLEYRLGDTVRNVKANWDTVEGKSILQLTFTDLETGVSSRDWFTLEQLKVKPYLQKRFTQLWGELLRAKMDQQLLAIGSET